MEIAINCAIQNDLFDNWKAIYYVNVNGIVDFPYISVGVLVMPLIMESDAINWIEIQTMNFIAVFNIWNGKIEVQ